MRGKPMWAWRCVIVAVSLGQVGAGLAWFAREPDRDIGRFGLAVGAAVGGLGLVGQATRFLRPAAVAANGLLALVCLPGLLAGLTALVFPAPGGSPGVAPVAIAAATVIGSSASARGLWRLSAGASAG
jgi:hypothetical protein